LLHRISNDRDQELVNKLVPDNLRGLLRELPSLPSQRAILLGWASELPVMVQMKYLDKEHRPKSDDPDHWDVWTGEKGRKVNWKEIVLDWQATGQTQSEADITGQQAKQIRVNAEPVEKIIEDTDSCSYDEVPF
jgi:hypothetical protein